MIIGVVRPMMLTFVRLDGTTTLTIVLPTNVSMVAVSMVLLAILVPVTLAGMVNSATTTLMTVPLTRVPTVVPVSMVLMATLALVPRVGMVIIAITTSLKQKNKLPCYKMVGRQLIIQVKI